MKLFPKMLKTSRPLFWFSHFISLFYGALQAQHSNIFGFPLLFSFLIFSLPYSIFIYAINDYYDLKSDSINPRKATIFGERHDDKSIKYLKVWGFSGLTISILLSFLLSINVVILMITLSIILYFYSSPPIHLKSVPIADAIFGGALYSYIISVIGYVVVAGLPNSLLTFISAPFLLFSLLGLFGHLMGAVLDEKPDRKSNITTSPIFFGSTSVITFCILLLFICLFISRHNPLFLIAISMTIVICFLGYSSKWRESPFLQALGGGILPVGFFYLSLLVYFLNPNWLKI